MDAGGGSTMRFTPVSLVPDKAMPAIDSIEIELVEGVRLRVDAVVDEAAMKDVPRGLGR